MRPEEISSETSDPAVGLWAAEAAQSPTAGGSAEISSARATIRAVLVMLVYQGYTLSILGVAAPWIAASFNLSESGIARVYAWISINALGGLMLARMADRVGRRRILLCSLGGTPVCALGALLSTTTLWFAVFEVLVYAFIAATIAVSIVMVAEELPMERRARGQGWAGLAMAIGSALCLLLMPLLRRGGYSWRWLLVFTVMGIVLLPLMARRIPESRRWLRAAGEGLTRHGNFYDVFGPLYRRRAVPLLVSYLLGATAAIAVTSWTYFRPVSALGLSSSKTSALLIAGGALGMLGYRWGAWSSERFGRVRTVLCMGTASSIGAVSFYWGPPAHFTWPAVWLGVTYAWLALAGNSAAVATNSAVTELFPTALRSTMLGWFALVSAFSAVIAQGAIAILAGPWGGLSAVVGYLAMLGIPASLIFGIFIEETRGLPLEAAAGEEIFRHSQMSL